MEGNFLQCARSLLVAWFTFNCVFALKELAGASRMVRMGDGGPQIWYTIVEEMEAKLKDIEFNGDDIALDWKKLARKRRIDREIFEKYGYFKDIILHPKFQLAKQYLEDHANFDWTVGPPLMPWSTAVIILFIMPKRVSNTILGLTAAFLFSVNPFYVSIFVLLLWLVGGSKKTPKKYKQPSKTTTYKPPTPNQSLKQPASAVSASKEYDYVLLGSDLSTLYAAALLSRCGYSCCVLQPAALAAISVQPEGTPCAAPLQPSVVCKVERYQVMSAQNVHYTCVC
ncbi:hypothetical protein EON65_52675 [archaeon]|nr:MAG: hypothetical protein EON65_52675 [archaeon]